MSLIDEALKRARMEAAQKAAQGEGLPYPTIPRHLGPRRRRGWLLPLVVALAVLAGVLVGVTLASRDRPEPDRTASLGGDGPIREPAAPSAAAAQPPAAPAATEAAVLPTSTGGSPAAPAPSAAPRPAETAAAAPVEPPAAEQRPIEPQPVEPVPAPEPKTAPPAPAGQGRSTTTAMTDTDSGVMLVLPDRPGTDRTAGAGEAPGEGPIESYVQLAPLADGAAIELGGIAWSETGPFALINGRVVGPGSVVAGFTIERIRPGHVLLARGGRRIHLSLQ